MDELAILGRDDDRLRQQLLSQHGAPAYVRRAQQVEAAYVELLHACGNRRDEWLQMPRLRLGMLRALAGDWPALRPGLANDEAIAVLERLQQLLQPKLRTPVAATQSAGKLRRAALHLSESLERFNERWQAYLPTVDLTRVNRLRDGYNQYYVLEKECAVRSQRVARQGFCRLEPLTTADIAWEFPLLPVPHW